MATFNKYNCFAEDLANGVHDLFGTTHTLRVALTNAAPNVATHLTLADIGDLTTTGGYTAGGEDIQNDGTRSGATVTVTAVDVVFTGSGAGFGPFRYAVIYNDTSATNPLIGYIDYASSISVGLAETFTVNFGASLMTVG